MVSLWNADWECQDSVLLSLVILINGCSYHAAKRILVRSRQYKTFVVRIERIRIASASCQLFGSPTVSRLKPSYLPQSWLCGVLRILYHGYYMKIKGRVIHNTPAHWSSEDILINGRYLNILISYGIHAGDSSIEYGQIELHHRMMTSTILAGTIFIFAMSS